MINDKLLLLYWENDLCEEDAADGYGQADHGQEVKVGVHRIGLP